MGWPLRKVRARRQDTVSDREVDGASPHEPVSVAKRRESWPGRLVQVTHISPRDAVSEELLGLIRGGELQPGARLPSEPQLIAMTGVSRSSVREAIRGLETLGLIEIRRGKGTYVREISAGGVTDAQLLLLLDDRKVLEDLIEVRLVLEPLLVRLAAERATDEDIAALARALEGMAHARDHEEWHSPHLAFHQALATAAHNIILSKVWGTVTLFLTDSPLVTQNVTRAQPNVHEELYAAIAAHDAERAGLALAAHQRDMTRVLQAAPQCDQSAPASRSAKRTPRRRLPAGA